MPLVIPQRGIIRPPRGPFAYPGVKPGFDPSHPLAGGMRAGLGISAVARGGTFLNLLNSVPGAVIGTLTPKITQGLGPNILRGAGVFDRATFAGNSTVAQNAMTHAFIFSMPANVGTAFVLDAATGGTGNGSGQVYVTSANLVQVYAGGGAYGATGVTLTAGVPYFLIVAHSSVSSYQILMRLDTGQIVTSFPTSSVSGVTGDGTYCIGSDQYSRPDSLNLAAAMFNFSYIPFSTAMYATAAPWDFWYPRK